ncbi:MAG: hypothetical protein GMKNLPBB_01947 [Myxococcota bacterium]|nr:hypothetical protein [Myxococcota bacterium]
MSRLFVALAGLVLLLSPIQAAADAGNLKIGTSTVWLTGKDFDVISKDDATTSFDLTGGFALLDDLFLEITWERFRKGANIHDAHFNQLTLNQWSLSARYRYQILGWLAVQGRAGGSFGYGQYRIREYEEDDENVYSANSWTFGGLALAGVEFCLPREYMQEIGARSTEDNVFTFALVIEAGGVFRSPLSFDTTPQAPDPVNEKKTARLETVPVNMGSLGLTGPALRVGVLMYW